MSITTTQTITESFTHDEVQAAVLELVRKRNPTFTPGPNDETVLTRMNVPPQAPQPYGSPVTLSLQVDVKITQDVPAMVPAGTLRVPKSPATDALFAQAFGRARRWTLTEADERSAIDNPPPYLRTACDTLFSDGFTGERASIVPSVKALEKAGWMHPNGAMKFTGDEEVDRARARTIDRARARESERVTRRFLPFLDVYSPLNIKALITEGASFERDLRSMSNLANRMRHAARARGDVESDRYFSEVYSLLCRDLDTVMTR